MGNVVLNAKAGVESSTWLPWLGGGAGRVDVVGLVKDMLSSYFSTQGELVDDEVARKKLEDMGYPEGAVRVVRPFHC